MGRRRAILDSAVRHVVQNRIMGLDLAARVARRWHRTGIGDDTALAAEVVADLLRVTAAAGRGIADADVAELGPGRTPHVLVAALALGARSAIGIDTVGYLDDGVRHEPRYAPLLAALRARGIDVARNGLDVSPPRLQLVLYRGSRLPLADASIDVVWSHSVLEHVRDPLGTLQEMRRVLRPGGAMAAVVDLRDHLRLGEGQNWLEMLRHSDRRYDAMLGNRSSWVNRVRAPEWRHMAERAGLRVVLDEREPAALPAAFARDQLDDRFVAYSDEDLAVSWWRVAAVPDATAGPASVN